MEMQVYVYDKNFNRIDIFEDYTYLSYKLKLQDVGSFSVKCPATEKNINLLKEGRIIHFEYDIAGIIQSISYYDKSSETLELKGNLLNDILDWRCTNKTVSMYDTPQNMLRASVRDNFIDCSEERKIDCIDILPYTDTKIFEKVNKQKTGDSILDFQTDFSASCNLGFKLGFYPKEKKIFYSVIEGVDHTYGNLLGNKKVIFSDAFNNILNTDYGKNIQGYRNVAYVEGESESVNDQTERKELIVYEDSENIPTGWDRRELYVDARDIQSETSDASGNQSSLTDEEYFDALHTRGKEKLSDCSIVESMECEIDSGSATTFAYKKDYDLGDKVTIVKDKLSLFIDATITEITVECDKNGYSVTPTIGKSQPTLYNRLKRGGIL
jgi:hypothetical protein